MNSKLSKRIVHLRGGPNHGEQHEFKGGEHFVIPVKYEHLAFVGMCKRSMFGHEDCEKPEPIFKNIYTRYYKINFERDRRGKFKIYADYVGER